MTPGTGFDAPVDDRARAWAAIRARLAIDAPWLVPALFRAVPVAVTGEGVTHLAPAGATADRWGRVYVNFEDETTAGIAHLADAVRDAVLNWISGRAADADWHLDWDDETFPAVPTAQVARAAQHAASWLAANPPPRWGDDPLAPWRPWARRLAGPPQVSWQQLLGARIRHAATTARGHQARTYTRPARRSQPGVILPARRGADLTVAVIADVSGSAIPDLPTMVTEILDIVTGIGVLGGSVTLYAVDDEVVSVTALPGKLPDLGSRPGHGTDLRVGFDAARRRTRTGRPHDVTVVLTDAATPWPERRPPGTTIVALVGPGTVVERNRDAIPTWAGVVRIETSEAPRG